jgi:hypothetical protein
MKWIALNMEINTAVAFRIKHLQANSRNYKAQALDEFCRLMTGLIAAVEHKKL